MTKNIIIIVLVAVIAVLGYFLLKKPEPEVITVKVPVVMDVEIPQKVYTFPTVVLPTPKKEIPQPIKVKELENASKIDKDSLYAAYTSIRTYVEEYQTDKAIAQVKSEVQGFLLSQSVTTTVFPTTVNIDTEVPVDITIPKTNKFFIGGNIGVPMIDGNYDPVFTANLGIMNKKDNLITIGYGSNRNLSVGYMHKLKF